MMRSPFAGTPRTCRSAVVIGGGVLGLESAHGLKDLGLDVTVLEFFPWLLPRQLDPEGRRGLDRAGSRIWASRRSPASSRPAIEGEKRAEGVVLKDGRRDSGRPDPDLGRGSSQCRAGDRRRSGSEPRRQVVDEYLETSAPDVYAAGDTVGVPGPHLRHHSSRHRAGASGGAQHGGSAQRAISRHRAVQYPQGGRRRSDDDRAVHRAGHDVPGVSSGGSRHAASTRSWSCTKQAGSWAPSSTACPGRCRASAG